MIYFSMVYGNGSSNRFNEHNEFTIVLPKAETQFMQWFLTHEWWVLGSDQLIL